MEYSAAVSVMILDVMADINENFQKGFKNVDEAILELGQKMDAINQAVVDVEDWLQALEGQGRALVECFTLGEQA